MTDAEELRTLALAAAELVDDIGDQAARDRRSFQTGYREGAALAAAMFEHGIDVGYVRAQREQSQRWAAVAAEVTAMSSEPTRREMLTRRAAPAGDAYYADLIRHGGTEYAGAGKPRVPAPAEAYEAALAWAKRQRGQAA